MKLEIIYFFAFLLLWILLFFGISRLISIGLSYNIEERYFHFRLIITGTLFAVLSSSPLVSSYALLLVDVAINAPFLKSFFNLILPNRSFELIYIVLCTLGLNLLYSMGFVIIFIFTKALFLNCRSYISYEKLPRNGAKRIINAPWFVVNKFYDEDTGVPTLSKKGYYMGTGLRIIKCIFAVIWILEMAVLYVSILWGPAWWNTFLLSISKTVYLLPMVAYFVIQQLQLFLEGPERTEVGTLGSSDVKEAMFGDMTPLMYRFRQTFSEKGALLYAETGSLNRTLVPGLASNDLGNQQLNDCREPGILAVISEQLRSAGVHQVPGFQNAIIALLNGHAVNVRDNLDGEFSLYLFVYLNYYVSHGRSVLFVCADRSELKTVKAVIRKAKERAICVDRLWTVKTLDEIKPTEHTGVLLCTAKDLFSVNLNGNYNYLADNLVGAVFPNCTSLLSLDSIHIEKIFHQIDILPHLEHYVFLSEEDNVSLSVGIKRSLPEGMNLYSFSNDARAPRTDIMVWREEGVCKPQLTLGIGDHGSPYLGIALPLALFAAKYDLPKVYIVPRSDRGDIYYFKSARQSNEAHIQEFLEERNDLDSIIRYSFSEAIEPQDLKMLVIYDADYNFYDALWKWFKYAGNNGTLIHVISPHYMLREYFVAKRRTLLASNNVYKALFTNNTVLKRTRLASLLATIAEEGLTPDEIMSISRKYNWSYNNFSALLKDAILTVKSKTEFHSIYEHFSTVEEPPVFRGNRTGFSRSVRVKLIDTDLLERQKALMSFARLSFKTNIFEDIPVLSGNLWNYYLPQQTFAFQGEFYTVSSIDSEAGIVYAVPAHPVNVFEYYPISRYSLSNYKCLDDCVDNPILDCNICQATAIKTIYGYISSTNGNSFSLGESAPIVNRISDGRMNVKKITLNEIPVLEINFRLASINEAGERNAPERVTALLCVILNGLFKTLFPKTYQNIVATTEQSVDTNLIDRTVSHGLEYTEQDLIRATIPGIDPVEKAKKDASVKIYVLEFSCVEYGLVKAVYDNLASILGMAYDYLDWYLTSNADSEGESNDTNRMRGRYLHFGMDNIPDLFNLDALHTLLYSILHCSDAEVTAEPNLTEEAEEPDNPLQTCSFCGKEIVFGWKLDDNRCMCRNCHDHQKTQKEEIKTLFYGAKKNMEEYYHITFRKDINIGFRSAKEIQNVAGGSNFSRVIGFYSHGKRQLWIETKGPAVAMESTIVHELTHAWQYDNLPINKLAGCFPRSVRWKRIRLLMEGHAVLVELEVMKSLGERAYAERIRANYSCGENEYSLGYILVSDYFSKLELEGDTSSSFEKMRTLVNRIISKEASLLWPEGY